MLSKKMKRPALAVEIKTGRPGAKPGDERDEDEGSEDGDDDEAGYASMFGSERDDGGGKDDGADEGAGDEGDGDGDDMDDLHGEPDADDAADGSAAPKLSPHELAHTSLADASYEQLMAAAEMKKPKDDGDGDEHGGAGGDMPESDPAQIV
jgi:hypothetical protein